MKSLFLSVIIFVLPLFTFAQDSENEEDKLEKKTDRANRIDTKINEKTNCTRIIVIEQNELDELKAQVKVDLDELRNDLKNALRELENVNWKEINQEIDIAMEEARQGLQEANQELSQIRIEIDENFEEELQKELDEIKEQVEGLDEVHINNGSPRIKIMTYNNHPYNANKNVERNFSELNVEESSTLSDKMKKEATTLFDETVQNSVKVIPQIKEGKFILNFSLSDNKADRETTYIEVYDSDENAIYFESLVDFSGAYEGEIDLAVNGTDTYTLVVRQGKKYLSRKISLK